MQNVGYVVKDINATLANNNQSCTIDVGNVGDTYFGFKLFYSISGIAGEWFCTGTVFQGGVSKDFVRPVPNGYLSQIVLSYNGVSQITVRYIINPGASGAPSIHISTAVYNGAYDLYAFDKSRSPQQLPLSFYIEPYPVGAIYRTIEDNVIPDQLFGGVWRELTTETITPTLGPLPRDPVTVHIWLREQ